LRPLEENLRRQACLNPLRKPTCLPEIDRQSGGYYIDPIKLNQSRQDPTYILNVIWITLDEAAAA
jgi:hypothetical protein